ncbi:winged helix-turn-helix transcriptional regulator [bacterium]|nr:winged helix-turn-helix transcriptional regulator [bacterium]
MNDLVKTFKALSDKNRIRIYKMLQQKSMCVCEITAVLELAASTVSKHLSILKAAGFIQDQKDGKWVDYHLKQLSTDPYVASMLPLLNFWLNDDPQITLDRQRLAQNTRDQLNKCS